MAKFTARQFADAGFTREEGRDFHDDGTNFKGYSYKGLPVSYTTADGMVYLAVRVDYLAEFNYEEYSKMPSYQLADEFNGVDASEVDIEKVKQNIDKLNADMEALRAKLKTAKIDTVGITRAMVAEQEEIKELLKELATVEWFTRNEYEIKRISDYAKTIKKTAELPINLEFIESAKPRTQRDWQRKLEEGKEMLNANARGFYGDEIRKFINQ